MMPSPTPNPVRGRRFADLGVRCLSGAVLGGFAAVYLVMGGAYTVVLAAAAAAMMAWEAWRIIMGPAGGTGVMAGLFALAAALPAILTGFFSLNSAFIEIGLVLVVLAASGHARNLWLAATFVVIALSMAELVHLRDAAEVGLRGMVWLFGVVIAVDVGAYFFGRSLQGPKLWPAVSPGKTWSGAIGGLICAFCIGFLMRWSGWYDAPNLLLWSVVLGAAAQLGDLAESAAKRRFAVKDASDFIPGHGGFLDRMDGMMAALLLFGLISAL